MKKTCCCCVSTILFIIIAVVGLFFGGTWYAYDRYGKAYCGITYGEVIGLVPGLYKANEKKIVTNPFNDTVDLANFEEKMKAAMFVSQDSEFSITAMLQQLLNAGTQEPSAPEGEQEPTQPTEQELSLVNQTDNPFINLLMGLNFDFSSLKNYEEDMKDPLKASKGIISAKDTEIAALFSAAFATILDSKMNSVAGVKTSEILSVKQVVISGANEGASEADVRLTATIKLDISKAIKTALSAQSSIPGFASSLATTILPKSLFVSLVIAPYATDVLPTVSVNEYSDKNNELIMTMIKNIVNKMGGDETKFDSLFNSVDDYIKTVFAKVKTMVDIKFVGESAELDAIYTMMSMLKLNVNKEDFLLMISQLKCPNEEAIKALSNLNYEKAEIDNFMLDIKQNYAISDSLDINKDNLTTKLGQVPNNLDLNKIDFNKTNEQMSTVMKYDALIAIMEQQFKASNTPATPMSATTDIFKNIDIKQLTFVEDRAAEERIRIVVELKIKEMMTTVVGTNALLGHLAGQFLPDKLYFTFEISLSGELEEDIIDGVPQLDENGKVIMKLKYPARPTILVNDLDQDKSAKLLETIKTLLGGLGGESVANQLDAEALKLKLSTNILSAIEKLENQAKGKIEVMFTEKGLKLPTIYELVQSMFSLTSDVYDKEALPDQVRLTIQGLQNESKVAFEENIKYQSTDEHNGGKLSATYDDLTDITGNAIKKYRITKDGITKYYLNATAVLNIYDKNINHTMKTPFVAGGATVSVKQTMFLDTDNAKQSQIMSEKYYNDLITSTGFSGTLVVQTAEVNIENIVAIKNPLIPNSLHMTYVFNAGNADAAEKQGAHVVINGLSGEHTAIIEQIISNAQNKPFSFEDIINQAVDQSLKKNIQINLPSVTISMGNDVTATINPIVLEFTLNQLIQDASITYMSAGTEEFNLGTAKLGLIESQELEVLFGSLTALQQAVVDALFPEVEAPVTP